MKLKIRKQYHRRLRLQWAEMVEVVTKQIECSK